MTDRPGDRPSQEPGGPEEPSDSSEQPAEDLGYWERQAQAQPQSQPQGPPQPTTPYPTGPAGPPGYGPVQYAPDHPRATTALVLGILGIVLCQVIGPFAWWMGKQTLDEIDASGGRWGGRGAAQAGYVMGIVGTVLLAIALVFVLIYFVVVVAVIGGMSYT